MERDALIQHGGSELIKERLMISSDAYKTIICRTCGTFAVPQANIGEIRCHKCKDTGDFGKIQIPYVFKVMMNYLSAININLTMRTQPLQ